MLLRKTQWNAAHARSRHRTSSCFRGYILSRGKGVIADDRFCRASNRYAPGAVRGARVPFKVLTDYLEGDETLDKFLEQYPSVRRELAIATVEEARSGLVSR